MFKTLTLSVLAGVLASAAVIFNDTPERFQRGQERRGETVIEAHFIGETWDCGDETCFAGLHVGNRHVYLHTGP